MKIEFVKSHEIQFEGSKLGYHAGRQYQTEDQALTEAVAHELIAQGIAKDPAAPPAVVESEAAPAIVEEVAVKE
jgi:hypothetical protein